MLLSTRNVLLLIGSLGFLINTAVCTDTNDKEWWETTLVYQIWPRGFQDSNGDGEGDLKGIINRLDYIKDLGVETIWLNPIYPSPLVDSGYDVSNYTDIHPLFGTLDDFDKLLTEAHNLGLYVILDIVPNHSSNEHKWFQLSANETEPYSNYYVWSDGSKDENDNKIPPNNWVSTYSDKEGSAWTWHDGRQQWYYHKFHETQPDLNLRDENVINELMSVIDFWLKRGVDGFRISAVHYFFEDKDLRNESKELDENFTFGLPENTELLYVFRSYVNDWVKENNASPKLLIAESSDSSQKLITYYGNDTHEGIAPFNFHFITRINNNSGADYIKSTLEEWLQLLPENTSTNWVLSNHDNSRAASRIGLNRVDGLHMLSLLLPGQAYTYYGEEIAMLDADLLWNETIDTLGCSQTEETYKQFSRDPARTPMQWNSDVSAGFSNNPVTYLPVHPNFVNRNVESQQSQERSTIKTYKMLASLRKERIFTHGDYDFATLNDNHVLVMRRQLEGYPVYIIVVNLGLKTENVDLTPLFPNLKDTLQVIVSSTNAFNVSDTLSGSNIVLTANAALVLRGEEGKSTADTTTQTVPTSTTVSTTKVAETTSTAPLPPETPKPTPTESPTTVTVPSTTTLSTTTVTPTTTPTTTTTSKFTTPTTTMRITTMNTLTTTSTEGRNSAAYSTPVLTLILSTSLTVIVWFQRF